MVEFVTTIMLSIAIHVLINFVIRDSPDVTVKMQNFLDIENLFLNANSTLPGYKAIEDSYRQA